VIESDEEQGRDLSRLVVSRAGHLVTTGDDREPYRVAGPDGAVVEPVSVFLRDLVASGKWESTLRSYAVDLLRWWRFLDAVDVAWDRASRAEARDFSCWIQLTVKQRLQTSRPRAARWSSRTAGAPNADRTVALGALVHRSVSRCMLKLTPHATLWWFGPWKKCGRFTRQAVAGPGD